MLSHYVYSHIRPDTGEVFYVGKGTGNRMHHNYDRNQHWKNVVLKCGGEEKIKVCLLASGLSEDEAYNFERVMICAIKSQTVHRLVNMHCGGKGGSFNPSDEVREKQRNAKLGRKLSEEHKKKIGDAHRGMKRSLETRQKMSSALKGKTHTKETIEKIRNIRLGSKASDETKLKMSLSRQGENHPMFGRKHTKESIEKTRLAKLGKTPWNKGKPHTEAHREALKLAWVKRKAAKNDLS